VAAASSLPALFRLDGQIAIVTGGDRGMGQAMAGALAEAGADVALVVRSGDPSETLAIIQAAGRRGIAVRADVGNEDAAEQILAQVKQELGSPSILINNAGAIHRGAAEKATRADFEGVFDVNLFGAWALTMAAGREMLAHGYGKIIQIASLLSFQGGVNVSSYAASKHALAGLTKALANEWAGRGVNVNAIAPGYIATTLTQALTEDETRSRQILERIPAGRWGTPSDLAGAAIFLASHASDYVTGHVLVVDGGWLAR
jgi:2-deoxy-D-gluconate 3-dehydrogenase